MDDYSIQGWSRKMRELYLTRYNKEHPPTPTGDFTLIDEGEIFANPPGYNDQSEHLADFTKAIRTRQHVVEDEVFGNNAAIGCHLANHSYFSRTAVA